MKYLYLNKQNQLSEKDKKLSFSSLDTQNLRSVKQWPNSSSYNYTNDINNTSIQKSISSIINSFLRMRLRSEVKQRAFLKRKKTTKRLNRKKKKSISFITPSKLEFRYGLDKVIIKLYLYNREKKIQLKRMTKLVNTFKYMNTTLLNISSKKLSNIKTLRSVRTKKYFGIKRYSESFIAHFGLKRKIYFKTLFFYLFLKKLLLLYNIKIYINRKNNKKLSVIIYNNTNKFNIDITCYKSELENFNKINNILLFIIYWIYFNKNNKNYSNNKFVKFNLKILKKLSFFKNYFLPQFFRKFFKNLAILLRFHSRINKNINIYNSYLLYQENLLSQMLNKKVNIYITELKYPQLNANILFKSFAKKSSYKTANIRLMSRLMRIIKLPRYNKLILKKNYREYYNFNLLENFLYKKESSLLKLFNSNNLILCLRSLNILPYICSNSTNSKLSVGITNNANETYFKQKKVLNSLNYKWIKGVKLEIKGRITRRFTAARALYKYKYLGNLKNMEYSRYNYKFLKRNIFKSNMESTFIKSKKRIGAFGVKGWISTI